MGISLVTLVLMVGLTITTTVALLLPKTSISDSLSESYDYEDYSTNVEQYPVANKRAALLLDRLMVALQKAVDEQGIRTPSGIKAEKSSIIRAKPRLQASNIGLVRSASSKSGMDLQRRGHANGGSVYWRCYFNAVTCFKKK